MPLEIDDEATQPDRPDEERTLEDHEPHQADSGTSRVERVGDQADVQDARHAEAAQDADDRGREDCKACRTTDRPEAKTALKTNATHAARVQPLSSPQDLKSAKPQPTELTDLIAESPETSPIST